MLLEKYTAYLKEGTEEITKVSLEIDEWTALLSNIANHAPNNVDTGEKISQSELEWIDANGCVPLYRNEDYIKRYGADTRLVSLVLDPIGELFLRFWYGENGVNTTLNKVMEEVFPTATPKDVLNEIWRWWSSLPVDTQSVGNMLVTKRQKEFGLGHVHVWLRDRMYGENKQPKPAINRYHYNLRPWMYAFELFLEWSKENLIVNNDGKLLPATS